MSCEFNEELLENFFEQALELGLTEKEVVEISRKKFEVAQ